MRQINLRLQGEMEEGLERERKRIGFARTVIVKIALRKYLDDQVSGATKPSHLDYDQIPEDGVQ